MKDAKHAALARTMPIQSATFKNAVNAEIRRAAATGICDIRGGGAKRRVPHFGDLLFLGDNDPKWDSEYWQLGTTAGACDDWHEGRDPAGITMQDPDLIEGGRRLNNYLKVITLEAQTIARACGHNHLHNLEPEDLVAVTMEAAAMAKIPLAGTDWYPGKPGTGF